MKTNLTEYFNPHAIGIVMKELVRRAMVKIREERFNFSVNQKVAYDGVSPDYSTSGDIEAQKIYKKSLKECYPLFGIIAEEEDFLKRCEIKGADIYFTVDPLDGTKAYIRLQSYAIGTMISLVVNDEIVSAYIGDPINFEIYGYRPLSDSVWWTANDFEKHTELKPEEDKRSLSEQYILLRDNPLLYSEDSQKLFKLGEKKTRFNGMHITGGSIGIFFTQLWKKEIGAVLLRANYETPWDSNPVFGISKKLGFKFFEIHRQDKFDEYTIINPVDMKPIKEKVFRPHELLVIHENNEEEFISWLKDSSLKVFLKKN